MSFKNFYASGAKIFEAPCVKWEITFISLLIQKGWRPDLAISWTKTNWEGFSAQVCWFRTSYILYQNWHLLDNYIY